MLPLRSLAILSLITLLPVPLGAQTRHGRSRYNHGDAVHTVSAGAYVTGGISHASQPLSGVSGLQGQVGIYAEYARRSLRPGLDARVAGQLYTFGNLWDGSNPGGSAGQKLIGPRVSYATGIFHPYVEGLFGTGSQNDTPQSNYYTAISGTKLSTTGTAKFGVVAVTSRPMTTSTSVPSTQSAASMTTATRFRTSAPASSFVSRN